VVQFAFQGITSEGERFLASARNDKQSNGSVISNPSPMLRINSVRDLSELNYDRPLESETVGEFESAVRGRESESAHLI
jgi:hypothetical protein